MPANAGIQNILKILDPSFRRDDGKKRFPDLLPDCKNLTLYT